MWLSKPKGISRPEFSYGSAEGARDMNKGVQKRWIASEIFKMVLESTSAHPFLFAWLEGAIEQPAKCLRQINGAQYRRTDTSPASLEHLEPQ